VTRYLLGESARVLILPLVWEVMPSHALDEYAVLECHVGATQMRSVSSICWLSAFRWPSA
jgi:hypothetical protein